MNNEIKEILEELENMYEISELEEQVNNINKIKDYITNLQQDTEMYAQLKDEYEEEIKELQQENERLKENNSNMQEEMARVWEENERLKAQLTDTEWEYQNTRFKYEKQYKKGITEELLEDIETCFFNRENPSMIPIDSLDICHIFGYIDYLKDYKSRCEKAIEYIENPRHEMSVLTYQNLLNILQNGSEEK